jgi:hypothetical protein
MAKAYPISPVAIKSVLLALIALVGCGTRNHSRELTAIGSVTSITVSRRSGSPETTKITGKASISEIVDFVDEHRAGWSKPWFGIPVPVVTVEFYNGSEFKGSFGVGGYLFVTQRKGDFLSRSASPAEVLRFLELVSPHSNSSIVPTERKQRRPYLGATLFWHTQGTRRLIIKSSQATARLLVGWTTLKNLNVGLDGVARTLILGLRLNHISLFVTGWFLTFAPSPETANPPFEQGGPNPKPRP